MYPSIGNHELGRIEHADASPDDPMYGPGFFRHHFGTSVYSFDRYGLERKWQAWLGNPIPEEPKPQPQVQLDPIRVALAAGVFSALCLMLFLILLLIFWRRLEE